MRLRESSRIVLGLVVALFLSMLSCQEDSKPLYEPINDKEAVEYNRMLLRCMKSGGTRVVKVMNQLRCY